MEVHAEVKMVKTTKTVKLVLCVFIFFIMMLFGCRSDVKIEPAAEDVFKH